MSRRILVTGATGLIGRALLPALRSDQVIPLARSAADLPGCLQCDLSDPDATRQAVQEIRPDAIVHLAGGTAASREELYRKNVLATVHLLEAAARLDPRPYVLVFGSAAEYGDAPGELIPETAPLRPVTEYGRAKAAQTALASWLAGARQIPLTILRPFNLVSPRLPLSSALGNMRQQLLAPHPPTPSPIPSPRPGEGEKSGVSSGGVGRAAAPLSRRLGGDGRGDGGEGPAGAEVPVRCGNLEIVRDFVPLASVVEGVRRLLDRPAPGRVINLCSGVGITLGEILDAMAERLGVTLRIVRDPALAALPAAPRAVGDPSAFFAATGLAIAPTPRALAALLLSEEAV
jgi:GDP-4-dehydro-6-deoxy-D-mannose reductase